MKRENLKEATTAQAFVLVGWYSWCIIKNTGRGINRIVHAFPWACLFATIIIALVTSFVCISKARAERDGYNRRNVKMQMELDSYRAVYGDGGREAR